MPGREQVQGDTTELFFQFLLAWVLVIGLAWVLYALAWVLDVIVFVIDAVCPG